jgi:hypothetical protein
MKNSEFINIIISAIEALGTLIIAGIAIFTQTIKRWIYKIKLHFEIDSESPFVMEIDKFEEPTRIPKNSISINLKIINKGKNSALNTQIYTDKIFRLVTENNTYIMMDPFLPVNYIWNNESDTKSLTPKMSHYIEIAKIQPQFYFSTDTKTKDETSNTKDLIFLSVTKLSQIGDQFCLGKGTFILPIKTYAENMDREQELFIKIFWSGNNIKQRSRSNFSVCKLGKNELPKEIIDKL